ncbi:MAG: TrkH family potassium uptake protein [Spirochaetaceae bacterium]|nr:TrkH family potassium uptake protein [Spirochaetaceae bacterium]
MKSSKKIDDLKIIFYYSGKIIIGEALLYIIPLATALIQKEYASAVDFLISFGVAMSTGAFLCGICATKKKPGWMHGMVTTGIVWILSMPIFALPYWLSGHYVSYIDCMFDIMSGLTTTGITLIQDLDHVSDSLNMWRLLLTFVGGQGIVVLALAIFSESSGGGYSFYVGEGKDERLFPSVVHTAKAIWQISLLYLAVGTAALWISSIIEGLQPGRAFLHALWIYMGAWSTGGFAPMSQNVLYYHSTLIEAVSFIFFIIGSLNFALHDAVLKGDRKELGKNIETISFSITLSLLTFVMSWGLQKLNVYPNLLALARKGFYQLASAHTTTGFMTVYPRQLANEWGSVALLAMIMAMLIGGSACSTAGGFKGLRIGILFKAIIQDTRRLLHPNSAVVTQKYKYHGTKTLSEQQVHSAALVVLMYVAIFAVATVAGCVAGFPLIQSAFEAASVTGNVGLSIGVSSAGMPLYLKLIYIFNMWAGRLEFMAILASIGFFASLVKKKPRRSHYEMQA